MSLEMDRPVVGPWWIGVDGGKEGCGNRNRRFFSQRKTLLAELLNTLKDNLWPGIVVPTWTHK